MKKFLLYALGTIGVIIAVSLPSVNYIIKTELKKNLKTQLSAPFELSNVFYLPPNRLIIRNLKVKNPKDQNKNLVELKSLTVRLDTIKLIQTKDPLAALEMIRINKANITVTHFKDDTFDIATILKLNTTATNKATPTQNETPGIPNLKIKLRRCSFTYIDERGFGPKPFKSAKTNTIQDISGIITFENQLIETKLKAWLNKEENKVDISGFYRDDKYLISIHSKEAEAADVVNYFVNMPDLKFKQARGAVSVSLKPNKVSKKTDIPVWFDVSVNISEASIKTTWIPPELKILQGSVQINNNGVFIGPSKIQAGHEILNAQGTIKNFHILDLRANSEKVHYKNAYHFLPFLKTWNLNGTGKFDLKIFSTDSFVALKGKIRGYDGNLLQYKLQESDLDFTFKNRKVYLKFPKIQAYDGIGTGRGLILINKAKAPSLNISFNLQKVNINKYFSNKHFQGQGNLKVKLFNSATNMDGKISFDGTNALAFGQKISRLDLDINKTPNTLRFLKGSNALINSSSKTFFNGYLNSDNYFKIFVDSNNFKSSNLYVIKAKPNSYTASAKLFGEFRGYFDDKFKQNPLLTTKGFCNLKNINYSPNDSALQASGTGDIKIDNFVFINLNLNNDLSDISIKAKTDNLGLEHGQFKMSDMPLSFAKPFITKSYYDFGGTINGSLAMFPNKNKLFLQKYGATGNIQIEDGYLVNATILTQNIRLCSANIELNNNKLRLINAQLIQGFSNLQFTMSYWSTENYAIRFDTSQIRSNEWQFFPDSLQLSFSNLDGMFAKKHGNYYSDIFINADSLIYKKVPLPKFKGDIVLKKNDLTVKDFSIFNKEDEYTVSGSALLDLKNQKFSDYNIFVNFISGKLENITQLYQEIKPLWARQDSPETIKSDQRFPVIDDYNTVLKKNFVNLYSTREKNVVNLIKKLQIKKTTEVAANLPKAEGKITGFLQISYLDQFKIFSDLEIENGRFLQTYFSRIKFNTSQENQLIHLDLSCEKLDVLDNIFERIDANATYNPANFSLLFNHFYTTFENKKSNNILTGTLNLGPIIDKTIPEKPNDINLKLDLYKNDINILSIFNGAVRQIKNDGPIFLDITGQPTRPVINSQVFSLKNFEMSFMPDFPLQSPIKVPKADLSIKNNVIEIPQTSVIWQGKDTNQHKNEFIAAGTINVDPSLQDLSRIPVLFNLTVKPTNLDINLPNLYIGKAEVGQTYLNGLLTIPLNKAARKEFNENVLFEKENGPTIKTSINLNEGHVIVLANKKNQKFKPSFKLEATTNLGKKIVVSGKDFQTAGNSFISNIEIALAEDNSDIQIKGSLNTIDLEHKFKLGDGKIIFMNKAFHILQREKQREIFSSSPDKIGDNIVEIRMIPDPIYPTKRKASPFFNLKAYTSVQKAVTVSDNTSIISSGNTSTKTEEHVFVIFINGFLTKPSAISIEHYLLENGKYTLTEERIELDKIKPEQLETITSYLLPVLLRPQFYESLLSKGLDNNEETNELLRSYSASYINLWIDQQLQPFEKQLAKSMGLYDINIKQRFGEKIVNAFPTLRNDNSLNNDDTVEVEYIKDLFLKKLFVKVKTGINQDDISKEIAVRLTEYELIWALSDYISINYGNHNLQSSDSIYGAFSINANFDF